jgi:hypothetical protein
VQDDSETAEGPLVSVVIPAYRAEPFIETTLRSIAAQTHRPMDVVVVEDASPDATAATATRLAAELNSPGFSVRVLRQPTNLGCAAALRRGFAEARGDLICWLSADDAYLEPRKTELQIRALSSGGGLSFCRSFTYGPAPDDAEYTIHHWVDRLPLADRLFDAWPTWRLLKLLLYNPINGSSVMIPRSSIEQLGTFDPFVGNIDQDADLWMRYSALRARFRAVEAGPVFYRVHPGQTTNLTDRVHRGCTTNRLRILLALEESACLGSVLRRSWPVLLPVLRGGYRVWPAVTRRLVSAGLATDCGAAARVVLGRLRVRLYRDGLWECDDEELLAAAHEAMGSEEFVRFRQSLAGRSCGVSAQVRHD